MAEHFTPEGIRQMPQRFRLTSISREAAERSGYRMEASLYHDKASLAVTWTVKQPDTRLKPGVLVSPRYLANAACEDGRLKIARVALIEMPVRSDSLFLTIPPEWIADRGLVRRAGALWELLPLNWQELFNRILWNGQRFHLACVGPGSLRGHHSERNGNFRHMVETGEAVLSLLPQHPAADRAISLFSGLTHDLAKSVEYESTNNGWEMSRTGTLNGHRQLIGDWIAVARDQMKLGIPEDHYQSMRHAVGAARDVPFESGYRPPMTPEARLLSLADQSSGSGDLFARQAAPDGGWGKMHPHLGGRMPFTVTSERNRIGRRAAGHGAASSESDGLGDSERVCCLLGGAANDD